MAAAEGFTTISCSEFARAVLRRRYTPAQRTWVQVARDRVQPAVLEGREREIAEEMFGPIEHVPESAYRMEVLYAGRDSYKSGLAIDGGIWRMVTADLAAIGPGEIPVVLVASPDLKTSRMLVRRALAEVKQAAHLAPLLESESSEGFILRRHDGKLVGFEAAAASRGGFTARGRPILDLILEESDLHYAGELYVRTDAEMVRAASPRLMKDGSVIFITTPWGDESYARKLFIENNGAPKTALVARASTLLMRDNDPDVARNIEAELAADPTNAQREFFCDMTVVAGSAFGNPVDVEACFEPLPEGYVVYEY